MKASPHTSRLAPATPAAMATAPVGSPLMLTARDAREMMSSNPVSIRANASVQDALALLTDHEFGAVPVIDKFGRPIGVLSRTDLIRFERQHIEYLRSTPAAPVDEELTLPSGENLDDGFQLEATATVSVTQAMTPKVLSVAPATPAADVVRLMLDKHVHHLFVVDADGVLIGVISTMDVLRKLME